MKENVKLLMQIGDSMLEGRHESSHPRPYNPHKGTARVVFNMMTESTGASLLDSGEYYGRKWQSNRKNGFDTAPNAWPSFDHDGKIDGICVNTFALLCDYLDYDDALQKRFMCWCARTDPDNQKAWLESMEEFADSVDSEYGVCNTCNDEHSLMDVVQFVRFTDEDGETGILLQYHGGCDLRGGYTRPRAFRVNDMDCFLSAMDSASAGCRCGTVYLYSGCLESDDLEEDGFPESWIRDGRNAVCTECGERVWFDMHQH